MKTVHGDLLQLAKSGHFDVIVQGCNCFNTMGSGIAKSIREQFPEAYAADCKTVKGDKNKLGTFTKAAVQCGTHSLVVVNAYTQYKYGGPERNADYDAIRSAFRRIKQEFAGARIGYPQIGAGLARGDWNLISGIINEELAGENHTAVIYAPSQAPAVSDSAPRSRLRR